MRVSNIEGNKSIIYKQGDTSDIHFTIAASCIFTVCLFGMLGNGIAFWFLSFRIPRNKYTVYIINLMIADFIYLFFNATLMTLHIDQLMGFHPYSPGIAKANLLLELMYDGAYQGGMLFLLAISIERCLSVYYPIWYRCRRPKHQSIIVCLSVWVVACLVSFLQNLVCSPQPFSTGSVECTGVQMMSFVLSIGLSAPLMICSSIILLIRIQKMSKRCRPPKLYTIIIITVFVFLIATVPIKFMWLLLYFKYLPRNFHTARFVFASVLCTVLSSSINPYIYFMVGIQKKQKKEKLQHSIQFALQSAFHVVDEEAENPVGDISRISYINT
ncbi:proto-oncogene Mas-like [Spea bombifrons]|uniref:proto-oncogene Mas-like n=1 Tax=Spea bombifrons TaxID=233779 RepID=UPI00234AE9A5|nr:proto-oncogene Mas-like [Spea bombifrons]